MLSKMMKRPEYNLKSWSDTEEWKSLYASVQDKLHTGIERQINGVYWYTPGNIIVSGYANYPGLWLVVNDKLVQCGETGTTGPDSEKRQFHFVYAYDRNGKQCLKPYPEGWLFHDVNAGSHPTLDAYNMANKELYRWKKENVPAYEKRHALWRVAEDEWLETLTPFEREVLHFDWTWGEADRPSECMGGKGHELCEAIKDRLEAMPYEVARHIWDNCGPGSYRGAGRPNWSKCKGFTYPDKYILAHGGCYSTVRFRTEKSKVLSMHDSQTLYEYIVDGKVKKSFVYENSRYRSYDNHENAVNFLYGIPKDVQVFTGGEAGETVEKWLVQIEQESDRRAGLLKGFVR